MAMPPGSSTPNGFGLVRVELHVSIHADNARQPQLEVTNGCHWTGAVDLSVVRLQIRTEAVPLDDADQIR